MTGRRTTARALLTAESEYLLATVYAGQVRAVVIERALGAWPRRTAGGSGKPHEAPPVERHTRATGTTSRRAPAPDAPP